MRKIILLTLAASALFLAGCSDSSRSSKPRMSKNEVVRGDTFLLNSDDFDLQTVIGIVKGNGVSNLEELENQINSAESGINNVDLDNDGQIDYLLIKENRDGGNFTLEFMAVPSSTKKETEANLVASMNIKKSGEAVEINGGYPDYVMGHDSHHYHYRHHGISMGEALFLAWMLSPRALYYSPRPYMTVGYTSRGYMSPSQRTAVRNSYSKTNTKVSPVSKSSKPSNFKQPTSASKTQSKFNSGKLKPNPYDKSLSSRNNKSKGYSKHSGSKSKATGFGNKSKSKPKSSSRSSGRSSGRSSSWGRSSGSRSFRGGSSCLPRSDRKVVVL